MSLGQRTWRTRNEKSQCLSFRKGPKRDCLQLHWKMYYWVKKSMFSWWLFMYEEMQELNFLGDGRGKFAVQYQWLPYSPLSGLSLSTPWLSILYLGPSICLDYFLVLYFSCFPPLPTLLVTCICLFSLSMEMFPVLLQNFQRTSLPHKWKRGPGKELSRRRAGLSFIFHS